MNQIAVIVLFVLGLALLVAGGISTQRQVTFLRDVVKVPGMVQSLRVSTDSDGDDRYAPVVVFATKEGQPRTYFDPRYTRPSAYRVGEDVEILYTPGNPDSARINSFWSLWLNSIAFGVTGLVFCVLGIVFARKPQ